MKRNSMLIGMLSLFLTLSLTACTDAGKEPGKENNTEKEKVTEENGNMDHSGMNHSGSGEVPEGLKESDNPKFEVGSQAKINADHMEGMKGAEATIVGAYDTIAYVISYTPTTSGERVENHKWVIQEEIKDAGVDPLKSGEEVTIEADHMEGMNGATATIDSAEETTVYMLDFTPTTGGEKVTNHKWVTESELSSE